jgi:hypothetical protein
LRFSPYAIEWKQFRAAAATLVGNWAGYFGSGYSVGGVRHP